MQYSYLTEKSYVYWIKNYIHFHQLKQPLVENKINTVRSNSHRNLPVVLSTAEVKRLLNSMRGLPQLIAKLLHVTGLRKTEIHRIRVKDIDFDRNLVIVKRGKGKKTDPYHCPMQITKNCKIRPNLLSSFI